jgi:hypothetical protein
LRIELSRSQFKAAVQAGRKFLVMRHYDKGHTHLAVQIPKDFHNTGPRLFIQMPSRFIGKKNLGAK